MAEVYTTRDVSKSRGASAIAVLALILAIAALGLAWVAYNRTGKDLETQIQQGIERAADNVEEGAKNAGDKAQNASDKVEQGIDNGPDGVDDGAR